jgi:hypothetical protein
VKLPSVRWQITTSTSSKSSTHYSNGTIWFGQSLEMPFLKTSNLIASLR